MKKFTLEGWAASAFFFVLVCWLIWPLLASAWIGALLHMNVLPLDLSRFGLFGDMYGAVSSFFAALAFGGVLLSLILQRKVADEARISAREQLAQAREINDRQRHEYEQQRALVEKQAFESTFFNLLQLHREAPGFVDFGIGIYRNIRMIASQAQPPATRKDNLDWVRAQYGQHYQDHLNEWGPYFRGLFHFLKFINESCPASVDRTRYANLVRARLTNREVFFLACNCTVEDSGLRRYVIEFGFLKDLAPLEHGTKEDTSFREAMKSLYPPEAFHRSVAYAIERQQEDGPSPT